MPEKRTVALVLLLVYLAAVTWLCLGSFGGNDKVPSAILGIATDKVVHFIMFFPFPILFYHTLTTRETPYFKKILSALLGYMAGAFLGGLTEFLQGLTTYRTSDIMDFGADAIGLALATFLVILTCKKTTTSK